MNNLLAVIAGIIITLVGAAYIAPMIYSAWSSQHQSDLQIMAQTITDAMTNAARINGASFGYDTLTADQLRSLGAVVDNQIRGGVVIDPFGGAVSVKGNGDTLVMTFDSVPRATCTKTATGTAKGLGFSAFAAAADSSGISAATQYPFPVSIANAATACANDNNTVEMVASLRE